MLGEGKLLSLQKERREDKALRVGAARMEAYLGLLAGQGVGIVSHAASEVKGTHLIDTLLSRGVSIVRIFSPEHGFDIQSKEGEKVGDGLRGNIPLVSLYGKRVAPRKEDLADISLMVFDLQDVGVRFYTYLSTLYYVMDACAKWGIPLVLLDRPNPNADRIDGPILEASERSFVGLLSVPILHGMTLGEMARMINGEGWLSLGRRCALRVIAVEGWRRSMLYMPKRSPSPNLRTHRAIRWYPTLCLFEGTALSVGRGTPFPFEVIGYPDSRMGTFSFVPEKGSKHGLLRCYGEKLEDFPQKGLDVALWLSWYGRFKAWGMEEAFFNAYFSKLAGNQTLRADIEAGKTAEEIRLRWREPLARFEKKRAPYLLYKP